MYKIIFGLLCVASDAFFVPRAQWQLRGHPYTLSKQWCSSSVMRTFFSSRVKNVWNNLPGSSTNISNLSSFCKTVPNTYLINFCGVNSTIMILRVMLFLTVCNIIGAFMLICFACILLSYQVCSMSEASRPFVVQ